MSAVIVTGGAGYVGSHACKALAAAGYLPVVYDNLSTGNRWAARYGPLETGDILDPARLHQVFREYRAAAVMHFAASTLVGESILDPARYYRTNVVGTLNLLDTARAHDIGAIVFPAAARPMARRTGCRSARTPPSARSVPTAPAS